MVVRYVENDKVVTQMPRASKFQLLQTRLSSIEFNAVVDELNSKIEGSEIETSCWMPGKDWTNTPFQPIHDKAARQDTQLAAGLFGLMVFYTFMNREDSWITGRFEKDGIPLSGRTYFRDSRYP